MEPQNSDFDPRTPPPTPSADAASSAASPAAQPEPEGDPGNDPESGDTVVVAEDDALPDLADGEWSLGARLAIAVGIAVVSIGVAVHLAMVFLHVTPSNTVSRQNDAVIDDYVYPEFEQNWKLFAPNPLQQNIAVHARAQVVLEGGQKITTGWVDLSKQDGEHIRRNVAPSHIDQNMLRRAWEFYTNSHDENDESFGDRGEISQEYVRRIVAHRFGPTLNGGRVERVQVRSATTPVAPPKWSNENVNTETTFRVVPWWTVTEEDFR